MMLVHFVLHQFTFSESGKENLNTNQFWHAVVISASDDNQMKGYQKQISEKKIRKEIPPDIPFLVFADPPGYKIGNYSLFIVFILCNFIF